MLLAVDTSGATSVALVADDGALVAEASSADPRGHAETIGPLLAQVLDGVDRASVTAVAYGIGPGPYTGLRVGIAAARAVALALDADELPVLSHDAVALAAVDGGAALPLVVVADAKRRERFATAYATTDAAGTPRREGEPVVGPDAGPPGPPQVEAPVSAAVLGRIAALRRAAGLAPEPPEARYLRSPDVTPSPRKGVGA